MESGKYAPKKLEEMITLARSAFENHDTYVDWLVCQNSKFFWGNRWLGAKPEDLLGLSLLLRQPLSDLMSDHLRD